MTFDYNSTRPKLILAEYGRNVQNMVEYICTLPTKEERNKYAQVVIEMMGFLNPHLRDVADFKHKLWDHLIVISDFKIDVDSPYPMPEQGNLRRKPETLKYPQHRIKYKHYGYTAQKMIEKARQITDPQKRQAMAEGIANFMKMSYSTWNKESVSDSEILDDLRELSNNELQVGENFVLTKLDFKTPPPGIRTKGGSQQNNHSSTNKNHNNGKKMKKKTNGSNNKSRH